MDELHARARCWAEISEDALILNCREAESLLGPETGLIAVLKADGYGLGAVQVAGILREQGLNRFAVACFEEAKELIRVFPDAFVLVMGATSPCELEDAIHMSVRITAGSQEEMRLISETASRLGVSALVHIKLDTGLHRLGFTNLEELTPVLGLPGIEREGLYSHLALRGPEQTERQCALFRKYVDTLSNLGWYFPMVHLLDSIGLVRRPEDHYDFVRVGAFLYGNVPPSYEHFERRQAVVRLCARVTRVALVPKGEGVGYGEDPLEKDTWVATLSAGYVDGYPRLMSGVGEVEIHGQRARVLGRVCMDQMMVDVSAIPDVQAGDTAVLLGDGISLNEFAAWADMNRNEVTCMIGRRVPRIYIKDGTVRSILNRMES